MRWWRRGSRAGEPGDTGVPALARSAGGGLRVEFVDAPERDPERDLLGRVAFAERVAATLAVQSETTSVVVGLYGPWGDGKTTLLRFIESGLRSDGHVLVVWFNPWFYKNEAQILEDFLEQIAEALGIRLRKRRERVGKRVRGVGQAVQGVNVGMGSVSAAGSVIGTVGGLLGEPTLRALHDRLAGLLADQSAPGRVKRIVVLVDDIDRLDVEQIATVFRMIKLGADFPRISFLLALDPAVVAAALSQRYIGGDPRTGAAFLEKIVQVPLSVPKADPSRVAALMNQWLTGIMLEHCPELPFEESARLQDAMSAWVWPQIATLRAGKRLLSTVQFVVPLMRGEVDPVDQVLLEALRILFPELYAFAAGNKLLLLRDSRGGPERAALQQGIDAALREASEEMSASGNGLLRELFPLLRAAETNRWYTENEITGWARAKRVTSLSHFDRYFGYGLPVGDILDAEVDEVFTADPVEAAQRLTRLVQSGDLTLVLQKLIEQTHDRSAGSSSAVAVALVGVNGLFDAPGDYTVAGRAARAGLLVAMLLRNLPPEQREQAAGEWLDQADVWFAAMCLNFFASLSPHEGPNESLLGVEALDRLGTEQAQRFAALPAADLFSAEQIAAGLMVFGICYRYGSPEQIEELFATALEADGQLLHGLLVAYLPPQPHTPLLNPVSRQGYARLAAIIPAERIRAAVDKHFPDAHGKVDQALAAPTGSTRIKQLMSAPDGRAIEFLALHRSVRELPPPVPDTVFEPGGIRPGRLNNLSPRSDMTRYPQEQLCLVIRAAALRPEDAVQLVHGGGPAASTVDDARRARQLTEIARDSGLGPDLAALCTTRGLGQLPADWTYQGEGGRETSRLLLESSSWSGDAPSLRAELAITTGWASRGVNQPQIEAIQGYVDIAVRLPANADRLSLAEVRDLLVTATRLFEITRKAGQLLPERPYDDGDGALWIVTNQPAFDQVIDLSGLERAAPNTGWTEVWLNTTLPLTEQHADPLLGAGRQVAPTGTALAVEAVKRLLQGANLRGYEPTLHDLLQVAP